MSKIDIKSMTLEEIKNEVIKLQLPAYRAKQIYSWLQHKGVTDFEHMTNLSNDLRQKLNEKFFISNTNIEKRLASNIDNTVKYLYVLNDGKYIESVLMQYHHGYSMCISTQAGCKMNCSFCATGKGGFERNLLPSEMLSQIQTAQIDNNIRISNVVLMGMGEPLDNYDNVLRFLKLVSSEDGMNIGMRHISLSTCGIVDKIYDLMQEKLQLTLSISLHAPNDEIRNKLMSINKKWGINSLLKACKEYIEHTGRRISFEYAMINGVNDSIQCANELASRLHGMICHVNLIPVNSIENGQYQKSSKEHLYKFIEILEKNGITATIRRTLGSDIAASCGQLKGKHTKEVHN